MAAGRPLRTRNGLLLPRPTVSRRDCVRPSPAQPSTSAAGGRDVPWAADQQQLTLCPTHCLCVGAACTPRPHVCVRYDNACNLLDYLLSREPLLAAKLRFFVDKWHHKGHVRCSPFMSHAQDPASGSLNSSVREQCNRCPGWPLPAASRVQTHGLCPTPTTTFPPPQSDELVPCSMVKHLALTASFLSQCGCVSNNPHACCVTRPAGTV